MLALEGLVAMAPSVVYKEGQGPRGVQGAACLSRERQSSFQK